MKKEYKGLKKLRNSTDRIPKFQCDNCGCKRYSICGCKKKGDK